MTTNIVDPPKPIYDIEITTINGVFNFKGRHLPDRERPNWHYYSDTKGTVYHFRKKYMVCVVERAA